MITIDDKEYRNLQEQVGYLTEELKKLKQSLGSALPEPIEGPQGPQGETGATGPQGRSPKIGFGYGPLPDDDSFQDGDIYIARGTQNGLTKGNLYRKVNGNWQLQLNLVGPQGPIGISDNEVVANPEGDVEANLDKIQIDGVIYSIYQSLLGKFVKIVDAPASTTLTNEQIELFREGCFINGVFLGLRNPIFMPCEYNYDGYYGIVIGNNNGLYSGVIRGYRINGTTKVIALYNYKSVRLDNIEQFNGVAVPNFPSYPSNNEILIYKTNNSLQWSLIAKHNVTLEFTGDIFITVNVFNNDLAPITDISELLEEPIKSQMLKTLCVYNNGNDIISSWVSNFGSGDLGVEYTGGVLHNNYNDDLVDIVDNVAPIF